MPQLQFDTDLGDEQKICSNDLHNTRFPAVIPSFLRNKPFLMDYF